MVEEGCLKEMEGARLKIVAKSVWSYVGDGDGAEEV